MKAAITSLLLLALPAGAQVSITAERLSSAPILRPAEGWTGGGLFNPAAIRVGNKTVLLFRARDQAKTSRIGYAESSDGVHFTIRPEPVLAPETTYEKDGGVEDPRVVKIGGTYYMTYTGYNLHDAQLCLATSPDLIHWGRRGVILPAGKGAWNTHWTKSGSIVPQKIKGKWWMYYLGTRRDADGKARDYMGLASSDDLLHWADATAQPVLDRRPGAFDSRVMEPGPTPIVTPRGILLLYNGADEQLVYGPGWVLFDLDSPARVIARAERPFLLPDLDWEKTGNVPNVIFLEGAVSERTEPLDLIGYYGGADKFVGAARLRIHVDAPKVRSDVEYSRPWGRALRLDVYLPDTPPPYPAIVWVHGGGFTKGSKEASRSTLLSWTTEGVAVFAIEYRLAPEFHFPAPVEDVIAAVRWLKGHAREYGVDPNRIALVGGSSGAQLVSYVGATQGRELGVRAVVSFSATHELMERAKRDGSISPGICALLNVTPEVTAEKLSLLRRASPYYYVNPQMPPLLLMHGTADKTVPFQQSVDMYHHAREEGASADLFLAEGGGHGFPGWDILPKAAAYRPFLFQWLKSQIAAK